MPNCLLFLEFRADVTALRFLYILTSYDAWGVVLSFVFLRITLNLYCKYILRICKYPGISVVNSLSFVTQDFRPFQRRVYFFVWWVVLRLCYDWRRICLFSTFRGYSIVGFLFSGVVLRFLVLR